MNATEYIALMQTEKMAILVSTGGTVARVHVSELPEMIAELDSNFKKEWAPYMLAQKHILFERLDINGDFAQMSAMLDGDEELANFLRYHMKVTGSVWSWRFAAAS